MKTWLILISLLFNVQSFAAGTIRIDGKLKSYTSKMLSIQSGENTFHIKKDHLTENQMTYIKGIKINSVVVLAVSFNSIAKVDSAAN